MLFLVMVVFFVLALHVATITKRTIGHWRGIRERILRPDLVLKMLAIARKPPPTRAHIGEWRDACEALECGCINQSLNPYFPTPKDPKTTVYNVLRIDIIHYSIIDYYTSCRFYPLVQTRRCGESSSTGGKGSPLTTS